MAVLERVSADSGQASWGLKKFVDTTIGPYVGDLDLSAGPYGVRRVFVESDEDGVLATDSVTGRHGTGATVSEAMRDLLGAIRRYHRFLSETGAAHLSPELADQLDSLDAAFYGRSSVTGPLLISA